MTATQQQVVGTRGLPAAPPPEGGWLTRLVGYCLRHRGDLIGAFAAALAGSVIAAVAPLLTRAVVDRVVDASGSVGARRRMVAVKGAVRSLLLDA